MMLLIVASRRKDDFDEPSFYPGTSRRKSFLQAEADTARTPIFDCLRLPSMTSALLNPSLVTLHEVEEFPPRKMNGKISIV
jgi:hypothetical protein